MIVAANIICIYLMVNNITGQMYIGQTVDFNRRIDEHFKGVGADSQDIDKECLEYGRDAFTVKILEVFDEYDKDVLDDAEEFYIAAYNTFKDKNHYNLTPGRDGFPAGEDHLGYRHDLDNDVLIDEYVNQGLTCSEIARIHNTSSATVMRRLNKYGIDTSRDGYPHRDDLDNDVLFDEYVNQELNCNEIARIHNTTPETIRGRLNKLGIDTSRDKPCRYDLDDDVLVDEYVNQKISLSEIARRHNTSQGTIKYRLNNLGIDTSRDSCRYDLDDDVLVDEYVNQELSCGEIAKRHNTNITTIRYRLNNLGIDTSRDAAKNTTGYYRVCKNKDSRIKQGFRWVYQYTENGKKKSISSVDLNKLEEKVKEKGLSWYKL